MELVGSKKALHQIEASGAASATKNIKKIARSGLN